jgi:hypothetical protein
MRLEERGTTCKVSWSGCFSLVMRLEERGASYLLGFLERLLFSGDEAGGEGNYL